MHPTVLSFVLIPLSLAFLGQPIRLLQLALVLAPFEASAALVFGGFGLQPALVPGLLFVTYVAVQYALGMRYPGERIVLVTLGPLILLLGYAVLSIYLFPDMFAGKILVAPQKPDRFGDLLTPLEYTSGNVTQTLYLAQNIAIAVAAALFLTRRSIPYHRILSAYMLGGYIEVFVSLWQFASRVAGVPFPNDIIYSNPGWAIVYQSIGAVPRIQGSFSEPAALAVYMVGICFCCGWLVAQGYRIMRPGLLLGLGILTVALSTSTTGLVCIAIGLPLELMFAMAHGERQARSRIVRVLMLLTLGGMVAMGPIVVLKPGLLLNADQVITATLSKEDSDSYRDRTAVDRAALDAVWQTDGFGVGWGSSRPSSLIPGLLSNGGVYGAALLVWFGVGVVRLKSRSEKLMRRHSGRLLTGGFGAAAAGHLAAALVSAPTITSLVFFLQVGGLVGTAARMCLESGTRRRLQLTDYPPRAIQQTQLFE